MGSATPTTDTDFIAKATAVEAPWRLIWRRLRRHRLALAGGVMLIIFYGVSLFASFIAPYHYQRQDRDRLFHPPTGLRLQGAHLAVQTYALAEGVSKYKPVPGEAKALHFLVNGEKYSFMGFIPTTRHLFGTDDPGTPVYLLGTDQFGRDIFSCLLYGSRISLSIGLIGIVLSFAFGLLLGGISGYFGGPLDSVIMRACELIMSVPALYLIMSLRAAFPPTMKSSTMYLMIIVILSFIRWAGTARVIRGMALTLRERQYVLAARTLGQTNWRVITRHLLPGTFSYVIVAATLSVPYYILGEVVLSFLGVGIQEPQVSWGNLLIAAQNPDFLLQYPWLFAPGVAIFLTILAFNFLGDGLRDAVDTKS